MNGFRWMGTMDESRKLGQIRPLFGGSQPCIRSTITHHETPHRPEDRLRIQSIRVVPRAKFNHFNVF